MLNSRPAKEEEIAKTGLISRVYVPEEGSIGKPLVLLIHGRAGTAEVMWVFSKALAEIQPLVISPQGHIPDINNGFSWWPVHEKMTADVSDSIRSERLNEVKDGVLKIRDFLLRAHELFGSDPTKTYIAGFSQGGALAATLSLMEPELFKGVAILSSFIPYAVVAEKGLVNQRVKNGEAKLPPYFIFHGTEDKILPIQRAHEAEAWLKSVGGEVEFHQDHVSHKVSSAGIKALGDWFKKVMA